MNYLTSVEKFLCELCPDFTSIKNTIDSEMVNVESIVLNRDKKTSYGYLPSDGIYRDMIEFLQIEEIMTSTFSCTPEKRNKVVKGYVQSKKTWAIISIAMYYLFRYRKSSFIMVRNNTDDFAQIKSRILGVLDYLFVKDSSIRKDIESLFTYLDITRGRNATPTELYDSFSGAEPRIYVCMRNSTDLFPLNEMIAQVPGDFALIIDEVDDIDNGRDAESQCHLEVLKERAGSIWGVTATPMTSLMKEQIDRGNVHILSRPNCYKDIPNFNFQDLPLEAKYSVKINDDLFKCDPNLVEYLKDFSMTIPYECPMWKKNHPRISLLRIGAAVEPQIKAAVYISKNHPEITAVTYNGSSYGITLRGRGVPSDSLEGSIVRVEKDGTYTHCFMGKHISEIIGILESRGVDIHPRIIILAGKKADRGISFVSSSFADRTDGLKWHLTELYLVASDSTNQSNLLQIAGRLCGVFNDNIPLTLFSNVGEDIIKAYWVQDELIERARKVQGVMKDIIPEIPISKDKCSSRRITSVGVSCSLDKVAEDLEGWDWELEGKTYTGSETQFGNGIRVSQNKISISLTSEELDINRYIRSFRGMSLDAEEVDRITRKMFPVWEKATTKIATFMQNLDPLKSYQKKELENACAEYGVRLTDCFTKDGQKRTKYGNLFKVSGNTFQLYPELVEAFNKYF
jgi:hypothetical protein